MPAWLTAFFANDLVKIIAAGLYFVVNGLITTVMKPSPTKDTLLVIWNSVITPALIALGVISGGTSNLTSNKSLEVREALKAKGIVDGK